MEKFIAKLNYFFEIIKKDSSISSELISALIAFLGILFILFINFEIIAEGELLVRDFTSSAYLASFSIVSTLLFSVNFVVKFAAIHSKLKG